MGRTISLLCENTARRGRREESAPLQTSSLMESVQYVCTDTTIADEWPSYSTISAYFADSGRIDLNSPPCESRRMALLQPLRPPHPPRLFSETCLTQYSTERPKSPKPHRQFRNVMDHAKNVDNQTNTPVGNGIFAVDAFRGHLFGCVRCLVRLMRAILNGGQASARYRRKSNFWEIRKHIP